MEVAIVGANGQFLQVARVSFAVRSEGAGTIVAVQQGV